MVIKLYEVSPSGSANVCHMHACFIADNVILVCMSQQTITSREVCLSINRRHSLILVVQTAVCYMTEISEGCQAWLSALFSCLVCLSAQSLQFIISSDSNHQYCSPAGVRTAIRHSHPTSSLHPWWERNELFWTQNTQGLISFVTPPCGPAHLAVLSPLSSWHPAAVWRWQTRCLLPRIQLESVWCNHKLQREHPDNAPASVPTTSFLQRINHDYISFGRTDSYEPNCACSGVSGSFQSLTVGHYK